MNLEEINNRLKELQLLKPGWDIDGDSEPPSGIAMKNAALIAQHLSDLLMVDEIDPDAMGGIALWIIAKKIQHNDRRCWFECHNDGKILLITDSDHEIKVYPVVINDIVLVSNTILQFVYS